MSDLARLQLDDWMSLDEAADYLDITRQAAGRAVMRRSMSRMKFANVLIVLRADVERYRQERLMSGPRRTRRVTVTA